MGVSDATVLPLTNTKTKLDLTKHVISRQQSLQKYNFFSKLPNIFDENYFVLPSIASSLCTAGNGKSNYESQTNLLLALRFC